MAKEMKKIPWEGDPDTRVNHDSERSTRHYQRRDRSIVKEGLSRTPSHDCLTALIFSHEIDGVRKEKERLTAVSLLFLWRLTN